MAIPKEGLYITKVLGLGRIAEHDPKTNIRTLAAEGADVEFGHGLMDGTNPELQCKLFASSSGKFRGVAGYSTDASELDTSLFAEGDAVPVIDSGVVTVYAEEAISDISTDAVRIKHNASGPGNFRKSAVAGETVEITAGAEWRSEGASGTAVKLFLNPPFTISADT